MVQIKREEEVVNQGEFGDIIETDRGYYWLVEDTNYKAILVNVSDGTSSNEYANMPLKVGQTTKEGYKVEFIHKSKNITVTF